MGNKTGAPGALCAGAAGEEVREHLGVVLQDLPVDQVPHLHHAHVLLLPMLRFTKSRVSAAQRQEHTAAGTQA